MMAYHMAINGAILTRDTTVCIGAAALYFTIAIHVVARLFPIDQDLAVIKDCFPTYEKY